MRKLPPEICPPARKTAMDKLRIIAGFSSELCDCHRQHPAQRKAEGHQEDRQRVSATSMPVPEKQLPLTLERALDEITQFASTI